jgi:hypothetical protein
MNPASMPTLRMIAHIEVDVVAPVMLGQLNGIERRFVSITGGRVTGPHFSGSVLPGGSDIQAVRTNGTVELVARYALDLGELGKVLVENSGIRRSAPPADGQDQRPYFRGCVRFDAPKGALQWLNESVFVSSGYREGGTVHLQIFELL